MDNEKTYELIEAYLDETMSVEERKSFEIQLQRDAELNETYLLHKALQEELNDDVLDLNSKLKAITSSSVTKKDGNKTKKPTKVLSLVLRYASLAAVLLLGIVFLPKMMSPSLEATEIYASYYETYPMALNQRSANGEALNSTLNKAIQAYLKQDFTSASNAFSEVYALDQNDIYLLYQASSQQAEGDLKGSIVTYDQIISNGDDQIVQQAIWYKALALIDLSRYDEASSLLSNIGDDHYKIEEAKKILEALK